MSHTVQEYNGTIFEAEVARKIVSAFGMDIGIVNDISVYSHFLKEVTQIDAVAVTARGVFVIEIKGWKYSIGGGYNDRHWRGIARSRNNMVVFNPIDQNKIHIRALRAELWRRGVDFPKIHNLVCVPDGTQIVTDCFEVCNLSALPSKMNALGRRYPIKVCVSRVTEILRQLKGNDNE